VRGWVGQKLAHPFTFLQGGGMDDEEKELREIMKEFAPGSLERYIILEIIGFMGLEEFKKKRLLRKG
jgi:hypothetical protein